MKNNVVVAKKSTDYREAINYSFGFNNIVYLDDNKKVSDLRKIAQTISKNSNVTFFNFDEDSRQILCFLPRNTNINVIFQYSISELSDISIYNQLLLLLKYVDSNKINNIYCLNHSMYLVFKDKYKFKYLNLDTRIFEPDSGKGIGIIAHPGDYYAGIMNEVSAITLTDYNSVKICKPEKVVVRFNRRFGLRTIKTKTLENTLSHNEINLYVNFCNISYALILQSMDKGIPCIVGNTDFFDDNKILKEKLVLKSDDSIDEIKEKIILVTKEKDKVLKEYKKFRKLYSAKAKKSLDEFNKDLI